jgi:hypothetical protein
MSICPGGRIPLTILENPADKADVVHVILYLSPPFAAPVYDNMATVVPKQIFGMADGTRTGSGLTLTVTILEGRLHVYPPAPFLTLVITLL